MFVFRATSRRLLRQFLNEIVDFIAVGAPLDRIRVEDLCDKLQDSSEGLPAWAIAILGMPPHTNYKEAAAAISHSRFAECTEAQFGMLRQQAASLVTKWKQGDAEPPTEAGSDAERIALFRWQRELDQIRTWQRRMDKGGRSIGGEPPRVLQEFSLRTRVALGLPIERSQREQFGLGPRIRECLVCSSTRRTEMEAALTQAAAAGESRKRACKQVAREYGYIENDLFWHMVRCMAMPRESWMPSAT